MTNRPGRISTRALIGAAAIACATPAAAAERYVANGGDDGGDGSQGAPWETLQHAADAAEPGDTVHVADGSYVGFYLETVASEAAPLRFVADGDAAIIDADNPVTADGINVENAAWITIEGFVVDARTRAGIRVVESAHVTVRGNVSRDNGKWGILTGCSEDILIEGNEASGSIDEHGIYHSNSADRPVIRGNLVWGNAANGIHVNSDLETSCDSIEFDGIISDALIEQNTIWDNGDPGGGSGINCDGVQDSVVQNNVIYAEHASGISFYRIDGAEGAARNTVLNNTVVVVDGGRWALNFIDAATDGVVRNNVLFAFGTDQGALRVSADSMAGLDSDYNVVSDTFTDDGDDTLISLGEWQALGLDANSVVADPAAVFADFAGDDYHLGEASPAVDAGDPETFATQDLEGSGRPVGDGPDIGAYELGGTPGPGATTGAGSGSGGGDASGSGGGEDPTVGPGPGSGAGSGGSDATGTAAGPSGSGPGGSLVGAGAGGGGDAAEDADDDGCGCRLAGARPARTGASLALVLAAGAAVASRRRSRRG